MRLSSWSLFIGTTLMVACSSHTATVAPSSPPNSSCELASTTDRRERLPMSMYSVPEARFDELGRAGFTMVGPYYGAPPDAALLDGAAAAGLSVVYPIGVRSLPEGGDVDVDVAAQVMGVADHPAIGLWYVQPEELPPWDSRGLLYLSAVAAAVRKHDPRRRDVLHYQANHRVAAELATVAASFGTVTRGAYANYVGATHRRAWVRWAAEQTVEAAAEVRTPWVVLEMFQQPEADDLHRIPDWVRHDAYASLVAGARGLLVFSGWPREGFDAYEQYFSAYLDVAQGLNGALGLADPLLRGFTVPGPVLRIVRGPARVQVTKPNMVYPSVASRSVELEHVVWTFLVNSATERVELRLEVDEAACPYESVMGPAVLDDGLTLDALGVAVVRRATRLGPPQGLPAPRRVPAAPASGG